MRIKPCPGIPNCACSLPETERRLQVSPLRYTGDLDAAKERLRHAIRRLGDVTWKTDEADYWHIECRTRILRFVDDLELEFVPAEKLIQVRSESRIGKYDFGVNRKRIERLRALFEA